MKIYSIQTSGDGLFNEVATNVKMLFHLIEKTTYKPVNIEYYDRINNQHKTLKFNYNNLNKTIKESSNKNQYWAHITIYCEYDATLKIQELGIFNK